MGCVLPPISVSSDPILRNPAFTSSISLRRGDTMVKHIHYITKKKIIEKSKYMYIVYYHTPS